ncbi:FAD-binding domain-containing protein [Dothidotthia symphoricarpi CBS 119687]|uniref:FAD-binding domain-containing protein n=1 Tax=Dothidotthia symphoricarpi CBS 119687 TaxID=1392245 RepID=A0A6A6ANE0_9PLEO|nr:FAD-binding domain-containing protein [Dothidotthia symphoricarpi CBS 119687]KAF2132454.1 FAD-binding domain-containing protein [Dothidotthia symphoricarpi CBS 119687]
MTVINGFHNSSVSLKDLPEDDRVGLLAVKLRNTLENSTVLTPDSEGYAKSIQRWSDAVEMRAGIVVYVGTTEDVSTTVKLSQEYSISFAVCGGKHSSSGASSSAGGLVIDLGKMRAVEVDTSTNTVKAQGGCIWKDVDEAAADQELAMVGGTVNHTGVGGLTLGGGYGWLSGRYGLTIDSLLSVEMVLADGRIVTTSKDQYPDLFWAVRGAGHCFGVAVQFTFQAHPQNNSIWGGQMVFPASTKLDAVIDFANNLVETTRGDSAMVMGITQPPFMEEPAVIATVFHNGPEPEALKVFKPLLDLQPRVNTVKERPYREMNGVMNNAVNYGGRKLSKGASFKLPLRAPFVRSLMDGLKSLHSRVPGSKKTIMLFEFFHTAKLNSVSSDEMSFANRGTHQNLMFGPFWDNAEDDIASRAWAKGVAELARSELERTTQKSGERIGEYGNYDALAAKPRDIFGQNLDRLREIKMTYDPKNAFNKSYALVTAD